MKIYRHGDVGIIETEIDTEKFTQAWWGLLAMCWPMVKRLDTRMYLPARRSFTSMKDSVGKWLSNFLKRGRLHMRNINHSNSHPDDTSSEEKESMTTSRNTREESLTSIDLARHFHAIENQRTDISGTLGDPDEWAARAQQEDSELMQLKAAMKIVSEEFMRQVVYQPPQRILGTNLTRHLLSFRLPPSENALNIAASLNDADLYAMDRERSLDMFMLQLKEMAHELVHTLTLWVDIAMREYTWEEILRLENIEQRTAALRIYGIEKVLAEGNAKLIDRSERGNELYELDPAAFGTKAYFLKYADPSTGRVYISGIDPNFAQRPQDLTADGAMAWKFQFSVEQYSELTPENEA